MKLIYGKAEGLRKYLNDPEIAEMIDRDIDVNLETLVSGSSEEVPLYVASWWLLFLPEMYISTRR